MNAASLLGGAASIVAIAGFVPYLISAMRGAVRPHPFTWTAWTILTALICQQIGVTEPGAWPLAMSALLCGIIALMGWRRPPPHIPVWEWVLLGTALGLIPLSLVPELRGLWVIIITLADVLSFLPTLAKSARQPFSEDLRFYGSWLVKYPAGMLALSQPGWIELLYPCASTICALALITLCLWQRRIIKTTNQAPS